MREYGSEHSAVLLPDSYFEGLKRYGREMTYLRTGREALLYVSRNCKPDDKAIILCPAYSCWSMIAPFEFTGWTVVYYRLNHDLTIEEDNLVSLLLTYRPHAVLTMNYYGSASTRNAIAKVKAIDREIIIIEDFSHCTFCFSRIFNEQVDFYVTSLRKSIGVCDGALIMSRKPTNKCYIGYEAPLFGELRLNAQKQKGRYSVTQLSGQKELFLSELRRCETMINTLDDPHPISESSMKVLEIINGQEIAFVRRENMRHLWSSLKGKIEMIPGIERCFPGAPFSLPILVENRDDVQRRLAALGVYAPVLWPISDKARKACSVSLKLADNMLSLPIDQRYDYEDIEDIARIVLKVCY